MLQNGGASSRTRESRSGPILHTGSPPTPAGQLAPPRNRSTPMADGRPWPPRPGQPAPGQRRVVPEVRSESPRTPRRPARARTRQRLPRHWRPRGALLLGPPPAVTPATAAATLDHCQPAAPACSTTRLHTNLTVTVHRPPVKHHCNFRHVCAPAPSKHPGHWMSTAHAFLSDLHQVATIVWYPWYSCTSATDSRSLHWRHRYSTEIRLLLTQ